MNSGHADFARRRSFLPTLLLAASLAPAVACSGETPLDTQVLHEVKVEAACGQCRFELPGSGCDLAVRIDGRAYFVDGTKIDEHGDAHAADGFCNTVRAARVSGSLSSGRFHAESLTLLP